MKPCRACKVDFEPTQPLQRVCGWKCALSEAKEKNGKKRKKAFSAETRNRKDKLKTRSDFLRATQTAFNAYIRERDRGKGCISCGTRKTYIQYCAGHFKTRGAYPELRFDERNVHLQCNKYCNSSLSGNIDGTKTTRGYREGLKVWFGDKEGQEIIDYLESPHEPKNWTIDDIKGIEAHYKAKLKQLRMV